MNFDLVIEQNGKRYSIWPRGFQVEKAERWHDKPEILLFEEYIKTTENELGVSHKFTIKQEGKNKFFFFDLNKYRLQKHPFYSSAYVVNNVNKADLKLLKKFTRIAGNSCGSCGYDRKVEPENLAKCQKCFYKFCIYCWGEGDDFYCQDCLKSTLFKYN